MKDSHALLGVRSLQSKQLDSLRTQKLFAPAEPKASLRLCGKKLAAVELFTPPVGRRAQITFRFVEDRQYFPNKLTIKGNRPEILWLCNQLQQWKDVYIKGL